MATCPECDAEIEVDEFDVDKGDQLSCPECESNLEITGVSPIELLRSVQRGLYAAVLVEKPDVDLAADRFRIVVAGYLAENGRAAERVSESVISGRLSELLRGIAAIGDDLKFVAGAGGGVGSPTLYVPRWKSS